MVVGNTNVRSNPDRLSECERILRTTGYISTRRVDVTDGRFEVSNPVPLTLGREAFRATVETVTERYGRHVHETASPYCFVVSAQ